MEKYKHNEQGFDLPQTREYRTYPLVVNLSTAVSPVMSSHDDVGHKDTNRYNPVDRWEDDLPRELRSPHLGIRVDDSQLGLIGRPF